MIRRTWLPNLTLLVILVFVMGTPAYAGGIQVHEKTIRVSGSSDRKFLPNEPISVDFKADAYVFADKDLAYLVVALVPKGEPRSHFTNRWQFFHMLLFDRTKSTTPRENRPLPFHIQLTAPKSLGRYTLMYSHFPFFGEEYLNPNDQVDVLAASPVERIVEQIEERHFAKLVDFEVSTTSAPRETLKLYLKANGKNPAFAGVKGGRLDHPLEITWSLGKNPKVPAEKVMYKYRLIPDDDDDAWTAWTSHKAMSYHFLQKGFHSFSAKAMYKDGNRTIESEEARYDFFLDDHLVVKPSKEVLYKGSTTKQFTVGGEDISPTIEFDTVYAKSKALIVGVWQFDDKKFPIFPEDKIRKDEIFRIGMKEFGLDAVTINAVYWGVRAGGGLAWKNNAKLKAQGERRILKQVPDDALVTWNTWKAKPEVFLP